jgi:hypothetical protein
MISHPGRELVRTVRDAGVVLTTSAALAYASGYLVLRSRAHALGTDPGFTLIDQAYVFAGFRFALQTLMALLVTAPALLLSYALGHWLARRVKGRAQRALETLLVLVLAFATLASYFSTLNLDAVLIGAQSMSTALQRAVLGEGSLGVLLCLASTYVAALTIMWARGRYVALGRISPFASLLILLSALQLILLPVQDGVFFADRTARLLGRVPPGVVDISPPAWLLDRAADRASLIARGPGGRFSLITVKVDALDGIPITAVVPLEQVVKSGEAR